MYGPVVNRAGSDRYAFLDFKTHGGGHPAASEVLSPVPQQHQHQTVQYAGHRAVNDDRSGDGEHPDGGAGDEPFAFEFKGGRGHGVGKAGDGHQRAGAAEFGEPVVYADGRESRADENERYGDGRGGLVVKVAEEDGTVWEMPDGNGVLGAFDDIIDSL